MGAQRFPYDFDGIVGGDANNFYQANAVSHVWMMQRMFSDNFAGAPAFDSDGDGRLDSLKKLDILQRAVQDKCDAMDGITDGVIDNPLLCDFNPERDLTHRLCSGDVNGESCFHPTPD